jgi:hypothetical protein
MNVKKKVSSHVLLMFIRPQIMFSEDLPLPPLTQSDDIVHLLRFHVPSIMRKIYFGLVYPFASYGTTIQRHSVQSYIQELIILQKKKTTTTRQHIGIKQIRLFVIFEVLMIIRDMMLYSLADTYQRFGGTCCFHLQVPSNLKMEDEDSSETLVPTYQTTRDSRNNFIYEIKGQLYNK